jgi:hypothetical protein
LRTHPDEEADALPNDFTEQNPTTPDGKLFSGVRALFPGRAWGDLPADAAGIGALRADLRTAAKGLLGALEKRDSAALAFILKKDGANLDTALKQLLGKPKSGVTADDLAAEVLGKLKDIHGQIDQTIRGITERASSGGSSSSSSTPEAVDSAVEAYRSLSFTAAMSAVAGLRSRASKEPIEAELARVQLRDRCAELYELAGDPPSDARLGSADTADNYLGLASGQLTFTLTANEIPPGIRATDFPLNANGNVDVPDLLRARATAYDQAAPAARTAATRGLAGAAELLAAAARTLAPKYDHEIEQGLSSRMAMMASLCSVFAEGMRGIVDAPTHASGALARPPDHSYQIDLGVEQAKRTLAAARREDAEEREEEPAVVLGPDSDDEK